MKKLGESGQALAETAISLSLLLVLAMATMDFGYLLQGAAASGRLYG